MRKICLLFLFLLVLAAKLQSQVCSTLGQTPATAFPVCGTDTFHQTKVPICNNSNMPTGCNDGALYSDKNPYWYKITCYGAGTLGFQIKPNTSSDDYDWQLFDVTGVTDLNTVYSNTALTVCNNWSSNPDTTGTNATATNNISCAGPTFSNQTKMPTLIVGHIYLLMVSHFTDTQDGYSLYFKGGSAIITDPAPPTFLSASAICGGEEIYFKTSKRIKCASIAKDGTDFTLSPNTVGIDSAVGYGCVSGFDTDSIVIHLNNYLTPGNYTLTQQVGTDGNTLLDICNSAILVGDNKTFNINAQQLLKAGFNYNVIYGCTQDVVNIFLAGRNISNFTWYIDGTLISTNQNPVITYKNFGTKTIKLVASNSVCADSLTVTYTLPTPNLRANFTAPDFACPNDSIVFKDASTGNPLFWNWDFGNGQTSALQNPPAQNYPLVNTAKELPVRLAVKDSACSDTTYRLIKIIPNCYIAVPSAFTPNNDGLNDYLYPLNAYKANNLQFRVYNRFGQIVFESNNRTAKWDGRFKSIPQPSGTYVWSLEYTDADTGKVIALKGTSVLIR